MRELAPRLAVLLAAGLSLAGCGDTLDEARRAQRDAASMSGSAQDYFAQMDQSAGGPVKLSPEEVRGRNTWLLWSGGNDRLWNVIAERSEGSLDLLKTVSSHPALQIALDRSHEEALRHRQPDEPQLARPDRAKRWSYFGLVQDPCYEPATGPDPQRFGLWLDRRKDTPECRGGEPFEKSYLYPGVAAGARGDTVPIGSYYGYATGIIGLRLFPNPDFDAKAAQQWNAVRYYIDEDYAKQVVRPYRVGMSCAFCHVGPNPLKPPADPEHPKWENLSSNVGAQYFRVGHVFDWKADPKTFLFQLFNASRPGTLDTSFISTDNINNPRTMNAVYELAARLAQGKRWGRETLAGGALAHRQLAGFFEPPDIAWAPHVLKDGADSAGPLAALNRVYANIGVFSEETLERASAIIGLRLQTPFDVAAARRNSAYWEATELQTPNVARFFLRISGAHRLRDDPEGRKFLTGDAEVLHRGKIVFAERCAHCHSSKLPPGSPLDASGGCSGRGYLACLERYWKWASSDEVRSKMRELVLRDDFLDDNFLSTDLRVPVTLLQTNACSPMAANATAGHIWDNFSSYDYKDLPPVGSVTVHHPLTGEARRYAIPGGGRGYTRPPSLVSLWASAPFLLNNTVGNASIDPSIASRVAAFDQAIEQMLWPEKRDRDDRLGSLGVAKIERTTQRSDLHLSLGFLPRPLQIVWPVLSRPLKKYGVTTSGLDIRDIPAGTPVNLIANLEMRSQEPGVLGRLWHDVRVYKLVIAAVWHFNTLPPDPSDEQIRAAFAPLVDPLLELNSCPDFEVNRGHYFGASLGEREKRDLIAFLKTF